MKTYVFLHYGFETPTPEIMDAWTKWFESLGDALIENRGPFLSGREITRAGTRELVMDKDAITGYSLIQAESLDEALELAGTCPYITGIRVYEVGSM